MKQDWALAVGITRYPDPDFEPLGGPEADARDFYDWVTSTEGGGVPTKQAKLVVSSQYPPAASPIDAEPAVRAVETFMEGLDLLARANQKKGKALAVGRRLYLYFSGHGFAPTDDESALLMANAGKTRLKHHVAGKAWANLFYRSGYFDEVLLFMDCCRNVLPRTIINSPSISVLDNEQAIANGHRLFAFSTRWGALSRERIFDKKTKKARGVFTMALMDGLRGNACEPGTKTITAKSLRSYLFNNMKAFLSPEDLEDPEAAKEPDIEPPNQIASDFTILKLKNAPKGTTVRIRFPKSLAGKVVNIRSQEQFKIIEATKAKGTEWKINLPRGLYLAEIVGGPEAQPFEVHSPATGKEVVDVTFKL